MANPFCLIGTHANNFLAALQNGTLDPAALQRMTSDARHAEFARVVGEQNAGPLNAAFESKLLLKNQQQGIINWIKQSTTPGSAIQRDLLSRVDRMDPRVLSPNQLKDFYADLAKQKLGFGVTAQEAQQITTLAQDVAKTKAAMASGGDRMDYGRARVAFSNYISDLKNAVPKPRTVGSSIKDVAGFSKAFKAAFDISALLRQGWKNLFAHPGIWARNAVQSFVDLARQFGGKEVMHEVNADIISRPNALNGKYQKAGLALGNLEEQFPTTLPEKIPLVGRAYKTSEAAFTGFQYRSRADVFDKYIEIAQKSGVDINDKAQLESIGKMVNSLTSRGHLGKLEPAADAVNVLMFSGRKLKSDFDLLTAHSFDPSITPFVRKQAAINLLKVVSGTAAVLAVAHAVNPDAVDFDPRSANFGKIKVGDTRFDMTGGISSLVTLAARLATFSSKSSMTGKVSKINSGKFGATTGTDLVYNFFENKLSPAASIVKDLLKGEDFNHQPITVGGEASNLLTPLPITNAIELAKNPNTAPSTAVLAIIADALGISTNTYSNKKVQRKR